MSSFYSGSLLPLGVLVWPLLIGLVAVVPRWQAGAVRLLPFAPLPALAFALAGAPGGVTVPDLLLGVTLATVSGGALLIGMTALVWIAAGIHAALTLRAGQHSGVFAGFWCITLAGNLGVFLAGDVVTFYLAFAAVSLAAWFLVVHDRTAKALSAGKLYITLAVLGEAALLIGLMIGAAAAEDLQIASVRAALADAPLGQWGLGALVLGFGIKAGMVPLHIWLPVAHPAAPVPGSAVLSGAIVKAGLIGMVLFLPDGSGWSGVLITAGILGAFGAAIWGLTQRNPKAVLAYSTVSQMGLMLMLVGAGSGNVAFYALHHGLAKAGLFLCVGVLLAARTGRQRNATLLVAAGITLSVAGLPMTGGALAKLAAKDGLAGGLAFLVTLSGVTTTLVLGWFLLRLAQSSSQPPKGQARWPALFVNAALPGIVALALPWFLWAEVTGLAGHYALRGPNVIDTLWPVLVGLGALAIVGRLRLPDYPPGDILALAQRARQMPSPLPLSTAPPAGATRNRHRSALRALLRARYVEDMIRRWPQAGLMLFAAAGAFTAIVMLAP
ncbi:complex I subunit 5 family protein [Roseinatronobacter sp.]